MTRKSVLDRFRSSMPQGSCLAWLRGATLLGLALTWAAGSPACARGAGIFRDLTARDRSQPILLSQTGEAISVHSLSHPGPGASSGSVPAYLAFPLHGGERFPAGTPTLATGQPFGEGAVGPLDLTPAVQSVLNADLIASRGAIVDTPDQSYAVAMLPRYARALSHTGSSPASTSAATGPTGIASILGLNAPAADWSINGIPVSELSSWLKTGTQELSHLTSLGLNSVSKPLGLKVTPTSAGLNIAAQELIPPSAETSAGPLPVPAPEPGTWLVFGLILAAAGLRQRAGRSV